MSLPFSVLVARAAAREPHRPIIEIARELGEQMSAARKRKSERAKQNQPKLYATKSSWASAYENY